MTRKVREAICLYMWVFTDMSIGLDVVVDDIQGCDTVVFVSEQHVYESIMAGAPTPLEFALYIRDTGMMREVCFFPILVQMTVAMFVRRRIWGGSLDGDDVSNN